jgi:hypothetical protein
VTNKISLIFAQSFSNEQWHGVLALEAQNENEKKYKYIYL